MDSSRYSPSLSLLTAFQPSPPPSHRFSHRRAQSLSSTSSIRSTSTTASPSSSPRQQGRRSRGSSPFSLHSATSSPSHSYRSSHIFTSFSSRFVLRRKPSTVDLALEEERHAGYIENLGLGLMEPRPISVVPVSVGSSEIWDGTQSLSLYPSSSRQSWAMERQRRSALMGDSPIDFDDVDGAGFGAIEGRLFGSSLTPSLVGGVEDSSFVMESIFEVMEGGRH